jgi:hypothetical protein
MKHIKNALWDEEKDNFTLAGGCIFAFAGSVVFTWGGIVLVPLHMLGIL